MLSGISEVSHSDLWLRQIRALVPSDHNLYGGVQTTRRKKMYFYSFLLIFIYSYLIKIMLSNEPRATLFVRSDILFIHTARAHMVAAGNMFLFKMFNSEAEIT